jgi:hypothetical protein
MLQAGMSPVRVPEEVDFSNYLILPATVALESSQPLTEMNTGNLPGMKDG